MILKHRRTIILHQIVPKKRILSLIKILNWHSQICRKKKTPEPSYYIWSSQWPWISEVFLSFLPTTKNVTADCSFPVLTYERRCEDAARRLARGRRDAQRTPGINSWLISRHPHHLAPSKDPQLLGRPPPVVSALVMRL